MRILFILTGILSLFFQVSALQLSAPSTVTAGVPFTVTWTSKTPAVGGAGAGDPQTFYLRSGKTNPLGKDLSDPIQVFLSAGSSSMTISDIGTFAIGAFNTNQVAIPIAASGNINVTPAVATKTTATTTTSTTASSPTTGNSVTQQETSNGTSNDSTSSTTGASTATGSTSSDSVVGNDASTASSVSGGTSTAGSTASSGSNVHTSLTVSGSETVIVSGSQTYSAILETNSEGSVTQTLILPSTGSVDGNAISSATGKKSNVGLIVGLLLGLLLLIVILLLVIFLVRRQRRRRQTDRTFFAERMVKPIPASEFADVTTTLPHSGYIDEKAGGDPYGDDAEEALVQVGRRIRVTHSF